MPIHYPQPYQEAIQSILLDELKIPALKFIDHSGGLYTTLPYALGNNIGLVVDLDGSSSSAVECVMGAFFNRGVLEDTVTMVPIGREMLIQQVRHELIQDLEEETENSARRQTIDNNMDNIVATIEDIVMSHQQSGLHHHHSNNESNYYEQVSKITNECIENMYFNIDNPHSLIHGFLSCLLKCPIDLRLDIVRNVCFIGHGVNFVPNLHYRFLSCIRALFDETGETITAEENKAHRHHRHHGANYKIKNRRYQKFQCLATLLMEKGPLTLIHPLPFDPSCISWVGGSVYGSLNLSNNDKWIHVDDTSTQS